MIFKGSQIRLPFFNDKKSMSNLILICFVSTIVMVSCQNDPNLVNAPEMSFSNNVQPIISGNCNMDGCHSSQSGQEAFTLITFDDVSSHVRPGNARNSELYRSIANRTDRLMPPNGPLSDADILTIYLWIEQGAKNN